MESVIIVVDQDIKRRIHAVLHIARFVVNVEKWDILLLNVVPRQSPKNVPQHSDKHTRRVQAVDVDNDKAMSLHS